MMILVLLFNYMFQINSLQATTVYDAVNDSIEYARDDSSRMSRGAFVINVTKFKNRLKEYHIKDLHDDTQNYSISILPDNQTTNNNSQSINNKYTQNGHYSYDENNALNNGYVNADEYNNGSQDTTTYVPIRAVQVRVKKSKYHEYANQNKMIDPSNHSNKYSNKYMATFVIQNSDTDPNSVNNIDLTGTKENNYKSANIPTTHNITSTQNVAQQDKNLKDFYTDNRNSYDLTIPSYSNED